eukprot:968310-Karenia_brevis.AAC.1
MVRRRKRDQESSSESERSIGVRSHEDPSIGARRRRMGMKENRFVDDEEDEEEDSTESSSSTPPPEETRPPIGAPKDYKEEVKEEHMPLDDRDF